MNQGYYYNTIAFSNTVGTTNGKSLSHIETVLTHSDTIPTMSPTISNGNSPSDSTIPVSPTISTGNCSLLFISYKFLALDSITATTNIPTFTGIVLVDNMVHVFFT